MPPPSVLVAVTVASGMGSRSASVMIPTMAPNAGLPATADAVAAEGIVAEGSSACTGRSGSDDNKEMARTWRNMCGLPLETAHSRTLHIKKV
jgi:hypothetical protein